MVPQLIEQSQSTLNVLIPVLSGIIGFLTPFIVKYANYKKTRSKRVFIGVVGSLPECLAPYADFTDFKKAVNSGYRVCVVHCKDLSFALRKMDFVVADAAKDPKIIDPSDTNRILAILPKADEQS